MSEFFFESYLKQYRDDGVLSCDCGREHRLGVKRILLGAGVCEQIPDLVRQSYGGDARLWILSDGNTEEAAGRRCKRLLSGWRIASVVLPADPHPRTTPSIIRTLSEQASGECPDLVVVVGGGTISDIGKMISFNLGVPNWCVATAPSVDAFTSGTSAVKHPHRHRTETARPTEVVIADLDVLERAPQILVLSGVGDLLAKYLSSLDWRISAMITGEYICERTAGLCLDSARQALAAARSFNSERRTAVRSLTDAILVSGLAMQSLMGSRPASSAEHTIAHAWEIGRAAGNPEMELHGLLVGLSCRILLPGYRSFYAEPASWELDPKLRLPLLAADQEWKRNLSPQMETFHQQMREEMEGRIPDERMYGERLARIAGQQEAIAELAEGLLDETEEAVRVLEGIDYPFSPKQYRIDADQVLLPIRHVRFLRNRYSSFNLIHEAGADERVLDVLERQAANLR